MGQEKANLASVAATLYAVNTTFAEELDREIPLSQIRCFLLIAAAGDEGVEMSRLEQQLDTLSGQVSRMVQALSKIHYQKDREGHDVVERLMMPTDNRRKIVRLTPKGKKLMAKLAERLGRNSEGRK